MTLSAELVFGWLRLDELPPDAWRDDLELGMAALRNRNNEARPFDWHFADQTRIRDVVLQGVEGDAVEKAAALGKCLTTFALPGLYDDGKRATGVFYIAPGYHGRFFISSLHLVDGSWRVERRHNFVYL